MRILTLLFISLSWFLCACESDDTVANEDMPLSEFLSTNEWALVSQYSKVNLPNGKITEELITVGDTITSVGNQNIICTDGTKEEVEVEDIYVINYLYVSATSDSIYIIDGSTYKKEFDKDNSTCETGTLYIEDNYPAYAVGKWSFDDTLNELTLIFTDENGKESISKIQVSKSDPNTLIFSSEGSLGPGQHYYTENSYRPRN